MNYHLAQLNVGTLRQPIEHPDTAGFANDLDRLNALAEAAPGFVWRLEGDGGNATDLVYYDDPRKIVNMSVWENVEALKNYVYKTVHVESFKRRTEWFESPAQPHLVLWWVLEGHRPDIKEAEERLQMIRSKGPSAEAFSFANVAPKPDEAT